MKISGIILIICLSISIMSCDKLGIKSGSSINSAKIENSLDSASYALGMYIGQSYKNLFKELNYEVLAKAIKDVFNEEDLIFLQEEIGPYLNNFIMAENKKAGEDFLAENGAKPGVITTASGLQYKIIEEGVGPSPKSTDKVKVNYEGKLINGKVFDSSYKRGTPAEFRVTGVIPGWTEALQLMKTSSKWELFIPSDLAYGQRGSQSIGPNETLIFTVELLEIMPE